MSYKPGRPSTLRAAAERRKLRPDPYYAEQQEARERREREREPRRQSAFNLLRYSYQRIALRSDPETAVRLINLSDNAQSFQ
jgi:hypothetical protein